MIEEWEPPKPPAKPKDLTLLSVADLRLYVEALQAEIARAEAEIGRKDKHKNAIAGIFKS